APLQLHIDLREGVLVTVPQRNQPVVGADHQEENDGDDDRHDDERNNHICPFVGDRLLELAMRANWNFAPAIPTWRLATSRTSVREASKGNRESRDASLL